MGEHKTHRDPLLSVEELAVEVDGEGSVRLVDGVSLSIEPGETFGMLGETGAGKSMTAWASLGLLPVGVERVSGRILYQGRDVTDASDDELRSIRGREIAVVIQNPKGALSPTTRVGSQLANAYRAHCDCTRAEAREQSVEALRSVGIADPGRRARSYPHELSVGMAQRVVIAMALLHDPKLLIADEPTSGLDVTIQAEILELLRKLVRERGSALWLITHDLGVIANYCDRAVVMFGGEIVETATVRELFTAPRHPYMRGLLESRLGLGRPAKESRLDISGPPPDLSGLRTGCMFAYRCPWVEQRCRESRPQLEELSLGHLTRCWVARDAVRAGREPSSGEFTGVAR